MFSFFSVLLFRFSGFFSESIWGGGDVMKKKMLVIVVVGAVIANILDYALGIQYPDPEILFRILHAMIYIVLGWALGVGFALWHMVMEMKR